MNIRELAERAGVSTATVSRALNGRAEVSEATRARVLRLARETGYAPNEPARTLVRRRSDTVGLLWDTSYEARGLHLPHLQDLLGAVRGALDEAGRHLMLLTTAGPGDPEGHYLQAVRRHSLEGVIVLGTPTEGQALRALAAAGVPCAGIDLRLPGPRTAAITSDNAAGAAAAVEHLHALGHRRIATITGPTGLPPAAERLAGFRAACRRLGIPPRRDHLAGGDFFLADGRRAARRLLGGAEPPTAIFAASDQMAIGVLHAAAEAGLTVPGDLSVVGFDDIDAASLVRPALTTVAQDRRALGAAAVHALRELLGPDGEPAPPAPAGAERATGADGDGRSWTVPVRLVVRESTAPPRG